jgi:hypothetical protein
MSPLSFVYLLYNKFIDKFISKNRIDYYFTNNKIIKENFIFCYTIRLLYELHNIFNKTNFINKNILILDKNLIVLDTLIYFLKHDFDLNMITQIIIPSYFSYSDNKTFDKNKYNIKLKPNINLNKMKLYKSEKYYIDNKFINNINNKKYDILFCSLYNIPPYYYNLINNNKNINSKYKQILQIIISNFYIFKVIKFIFNNINHNGNLIIYTPGVLTNNISNILSLLLNNFDNYQLYFNNSYIEKTFNIKIDDIETLNDINIFDDMNNSYTINSFFNKIKKYIIME